jgi:phosphonatase-like hydrolase
MSIKLAVFDMAGTTVSDNNDVAKAFQKAFAENGMYITAETVNPLMGYHKPFAIQMVMEKLAIDFDAALIKKIHTDFENEMIDFYEYAPEVKPMPGAEEVFEHLKEKGIHIALNTGFSKNIAETIINRFQWKERRLVDDFIGSDEVEMGRPYSFMIKQLMFNADVDDPMQVAKIGDTAVDIEEGQNAGCRYVVAVTTGAYMEDDLQKMNPTHIVNHLSELPAIFK